jgi:hypothetical protein
VRSEQGKLPPRNRAAIDVIGHDGGSGLGWRRLPAERDAMGFMAASKDHAEANVKQQADAMNKAPSPMPRIFGFPAHFGRFCPKSYWNYSEINDSGRVMP